jgi:D-tyrosyl-tRNA(Tyr) deacylase
MIGLIQRVSTASVSVAGETVASIGEGMLVLIGIEREDSPAEANRLAERLLSYRIFDDSEGRMNLAVTEVRGEVLLVPQFTLAADTAKGNRASFTKAADPELGKQLFDRLASAVSERWERVATGRFGANMDVSLTNRGPVTFWLQVPSNRG